MRQLPYLRAEAVRALYKNHCKSRAGVTRERHSFDKDGRCVFCDWLLPGFCELMECGCVMVRSDYKNHESLWRTHYGTIHCKHGNAHPTEAS